MIDDIQINKLIQPVLDRQTQIEMYVISKIANRLKDIGTLKPSDIKMLEQLYLTGSDTREINKKLAQLSELQERDIKKIIRTVAEDNYRDAKPYYDYRQMSHIPLAKNTTLQSIISAIEVATIGQYRNISRSTAIGFLWHDIITGATVELLNIEQTYQRAVDTAIQAVSTGVVDYNTAMRKTLSNLVNSGIDTVVYESDKGRITHQRLDTAVRRNLLDGVRAVSQAVQNEIGNQIGADGVELSVHLMSAPDHEPIQGHQFTDEEFAKCQTQQNFYDVNGRFFTAIDRPIGVWNCRHFTFKIIIGVNKPTYSQKELDELIKKNADGYTYTDVNGNEQHLSLYECSQKQRQMELNIRKARELKSLAEQVEDPKMIDRYTKLLNKRITQYQTFSNACGLKPQYVRTKVII